VKDDSHQENGAKNGVLSLIYLNSVCLVTRFLNVTDSSYKKNNGVHVLTL
jgi:hypothetical protein